jgi:hypothetical protein
MLYFQLTFLMIDITTRVVLNSGHDKYATRALNIIFGQDTSDTLASSDLLRAQ